MKKQLKESIITLKVTKEIKDKIQRMADDRTQGNVSMLIRDAVFSLERKMKK